MSNKFTAADLVKKLSGGKIKLPVTTLDQFEPLCIETGTIDTGSATMNSIISGSPIGGVPIGRTTGFYGRSGCGKSFIIASTIGNAQRMGYVPIVVDTENAWSSQADTTRIDSTNCIKMTSKIIENLRNDLVKLIKSLDEEIGKGLKLIVAIDSLAGLRSIKEVEDIEAEKTASDMGQRAKAMKSLFNALNAELGSRNITFLWTNHRIGDPSQTIRSSIEKMPGGDALIFFSDVIIGMKRVEVADEQSGKDDVSRNMGARIPIECVKQRFVSPFNRADMYISYRDGLDRYYGLFDMALEYGVIQGNRTYTLDNGVKLGYRKDIEVDQELWKNVIIPRLDPVIRDRFKFGSKALETIEVKPIIEEEDV